MSYMIVEQLSDTVGTNEGDGFNGANECDGVNGANEGDGVNGANEGDANGVDEGEI